jgi:hypothetical protein
VGHGTPTTTSTAQHTFGTHGRPSSTGTLDRYANVNTNDCRGEHNGLAPSTNGYVTGIPYVDGTPYNNQGRPRASGIPSNTGTAYTDRYMPSPATPLQPSFALDLLQPLPAHVRGVDRTLSGTSSHGHHAGTERIVEREHLE